MTAARAPLTPARPAFERLREGLAASGVDVSAPVSVDEEFMAHERFEEERPDQLEAAERDEATRRVAWARKHGSMEGYVQGRDFPCPGVLRVVDRMAAQWIVECDVCRFDVAVPVRTVDPEELVRRAGIPARFTARFDVDEHNRRAVAVCRDWARQFDPAKPGGSLPAFALWSRGPGRGKSHLLALICSTLIRERRAHVLYRSAEELFGELRGGFDAGDGELRWRRMLEVPVLALDDVGASRMTEWKQERLQALVDHRFSRELPLLVATNLNPVVWDVAFGDRTNSRLRSMVVKVELSGPDRRVGEQAEFAA